MDPSAAAGLRQDFVNDRNGEILLCVTLPCITVRSFAERLRGWGAIAVVSPRSVCCPVVALQQKPELLLKFGFLQIPRILEIWKSGYLEIWKSGILEILGILELWNSGTLELWNSPLLC